MTDCDHKFVDSTRCLKCGASNMELLRADMKELRTMFGELRAEYQAAFVLLERCWLHRRALPASIASDLEQWKTDQNSPPTDFHEEPTVSEKGDG